MVLFSVCDCVRFRLILFCPWCPVLGENGSVRVIVFCSVQFCSVRGALFCPWCCFLSVVLCAVRGALFCPWCSVLFRCSAVGNSSAGACGAVYFCDFLCFFLFFVFRSVF